MTHVASTRPRHLRGCKHLAGLADDQRRRCMRRTLITTLALAAVGVIAVPLTASSADSEGKPVIGKAARHACAGRRGPAGSRLREGHQRAGGVTRDPSPARQRQARGARPHPLVAGPASPVAPSFPPLTAASCRSTLTVNAGTTSDHQDFTFTVPPAPKPALSIGCVTANEGNAGTTTMSFPVTLSKASKQSVSVPVDRGRHRERACRLRGGERLADVRPGRDQQVGRRLRRRRPRRSSRTRPSPSRSPRR